LMEQVIDDGRNAVRGLRLSRDADGDIAQALSQVPHELGIQGATEFHILVEGPSQPLQPIIRDEVYRIGREAITNAFRHAHATRIDVALEYGLHELCLLVRDNGRGIDPKVLQSGSEGHWGLSGMRERAERIGAKLKVWSGITGGTEVELRVPGRIAFESQPLSRASIWLSPKNIWNRINRRMPSR